MKRRAKKLLSLSMAIAMAASLSMTGIAAPTAELDSAGAQVMVSDASVEKPNLPQGFSDALEESEGLTLSGAAAVQMAGCGTVIDITTHWNNENKGHASINDAAGLFKKNAFTVLLDVRQDAPTADTEKVDQRTALTIGNNDNSLHLLTYSGKFGYGAAEGGISANMKDLSAYVTKNGWNAVAMTYEEKNGGNGRVVVYVNGQKAAEVADVGFQLSTMDDLTAMIGRSLNTNYLQQGRYDNIVVGGVALDEDIAKAETAYRKYEKNNAPDYAVSIRGQDVDAAAKNINGLTYKGFGMLNGNSTSNLLLDYKSQSPEKYNEMMEYLFGGEYPLFTHIKMEMGNDGNNSTGAEACTMRYEDEEADASRSPGFVMAADAKKINPNVKISILRWEMPGWVADKWSKNTNNEGYEAMYKWYKETIFDAYEKYNYMVDFVNPDKNETGNPDTAFIKWFSKRIKGETQFPSYIKAEAQTAYKNIRIIASDENKGLKIVPAMREDQELFDAVDIIGFHYRTNATDDYVKMADEEDKEVWYSEGCATFGYTELQENKTIEYGAGSIGGYQSPLALMDSFITAFASSRRTHYMFQPAIGSFYEGIQYGHKELLSARDPWSGYIHYDPALYMLEHFAKFAKTGWEDSDPSANDIWRVISAATVSAFAGSDNEHATAGIDGKAGCMTLAAPDKKNFSVVMVNNTRNPKAFFVKAEDMNVPAGADLNLWLTETDNYLQNAGKAVKKADGWLVKIPAYSVATATTLAVEPERVPVDDIHNEDRAVLDTDATGGTNGVTDDKVLYADNFEYEEQETDYLKERGNEPRYMLDTHGAWVVEEGRLKQELSSSVGQWNPGDPCTVVGDFRWMDYIASADIQIPDASAGVWARMTVRAQTGMNWDNSGYTLSISGAGKWQLYRIGEKIAGGIVDKDLDGTYSVRIAVLGNVINVVINGKAVAAFRDSAPMLSGRVKLSSTWDQVYFDNLLVETMEGGIPYAVSMVDGQDDCVEYEGSWTINNPGSGNADNWYRTMSVSEDANASFRFPVNGCGFAIVGSNDGTAQLDVYVDGELKAQNAGTTAAPARGETYVLSDLAEGAHSVQVVVKSGKLQIDALHILGKRLASSGDSLLSVETQIPALPFYLTGSSLDQLPKQVDVESFRGQTFKKDVVWNTSPAQYEGSEFQQGYVFGTVLGGKSVLGLPLVASVPVEMVISPNTLYFIDSVDGTPKDNASTKPYHDIKETLGGKLLNQVSDQLKTDGNSWGLVDTDAQTKGYDNTDDMYATGIYGKNNEEGETLSYAFTLPAGSYKVISGHRDWWQKNRPMGVTLTVGGKTQDAGTINLTSSNYEIVHTTEFTLDSEELVTYTLTAKAKEAPVISWLGVVKAESGEEHLHEYLYAADNGDGTHTLVCKDGDDSRIEAHSYQNGVCTACKAKDPQTGDQPGGDKPGTGDQPGGDQPGTGNSGGDTQKPNPQTPAETTVSKTKIKGLENASKGVKISWNKVSQATGYCIERKTAKGKWQNIKTVSKGSATSYTDAKAKKNGESYQYRVYVCKGNLKSQASPAQTIIRLTAKNFSKAKNVKGRKLQLKWSRNNKAAGYEIQYAANNKFKKAKTVKVSGSKKTSKTISGLKKGKKYYVRIRCYKKSGKATYRSCWSKVKNIKITK